MRLGKAQTLPKLLPYFAMCSAQALGDVGEIYVASKLISAGYRVKKSPKFQGDLICHDQQTGERLRVEVKTARRNAQGYWQFNLRKRGKTDVSHADVIILVQITDFCKPYLYVIPTFEVGNAHQIKITSHPTVYSGKYAAFRVLADGQPAIRYELAPAQPKGILQ